MEPGRQQKRFNSSRRTEDGRNPVQVASCARGALEREEGGVTREDRAFFGLNKDCSNTDGRGDSHGEAMTEGSYPEVGLISVQIA